MRVERDDLGDGTVEDYSDSIDRYLIPQLGRVKLAELRPIDITAAYAALRRQRTDAIAAAQETNVQRRREAAARNSVRHSGWPRVAHLVAVPRPLGPYTIRRIHTALSGALKSAAKAGLIARNPASDAELPTLKPRKPTIWSAEQLGAFLDAVEMHRLYPLYHLAAFTGLRRGELCGLGWDDVDLHGGRLVVRWQITDKSYRHARAAERQGRPGRYRSRIKSSAGQDRIVDIDTATIEVLRSWHAVQVQCSSHVSRRCDPGGEPYELVFGNADGSPLSPGKVSTEFIQLTRDAGLRRLKFHGLRHVNISLQLDAGVSETVIAMRVGHSSPALIRSTYGHLIGTIGRRAAEATAALVPRNTVGVGNGNESRSALIVTADDRPPCRRRTVIRTTA